MWYIYTIEYYSAIKKNEILPFATTWVDLESIMLSEITQRKTYTVCYHLYVDLKKNKRMNITKQNRLRDTENKLVVASELRGQDRGKGLRGTDYNTMYKINKLQGYSVQHRKHSQYLIITLNGV